jgi:hypothetical protein
MHITLCAQNVNSIQRKFHEEPLAQVLRTIGHDAGKKIIFSTEDIQGFTVTADVSTSDVQQALKIVLKDKPFKYEVMGDFISVTRINNAADRPSRRVVFGKVVDRNNEPLPGVSVKGENQQVGAITDNDGNYSIQWFGNLIVKSFNKFPRQSIFGLQKMGYIY